MHLIAELGTLGSKCRAHFFFYLGRQDWQTFSISVLLPSVCIWTESGRRRWVQWSIKRSITCICYSPILKLRKTQARADPCCPPGKIDSMTNPPLSQLLISSIFISETEQKLSSVSNQFHVYHTSLCSASLSYSLNLYFVFSFFFQGFASSWYLLPTFSRKKNHSSQEQSYFESQPGCSMLCH